MSTQAEPVPVPPAQELSRLASVNVAVAAIDQPKRWNPVDFGAQQIRGLVRQVFLARRECRFVAITAVDAQTDVSPLSLQIARELSVESARQVCLITGRDPPAIESKFRGTSVEQIFDFGVAESLRNSSQQVSENLWLFPQGFLCNDQNAEFAADVLSRRLDRLRAAFDFAVIQAPATGRNGMAALLERFTDGVILVIEAHRTRRRAAQRAVMDLRASGAKLLGIVLSERTFPIPERWYRNL